MTVHSQLTLMRYAHRKIAEMAEEGLGNAEIARHLNELGLETSRGKPWSTSTVWQVRFHGTPFFAGNFGKCNAIMIGPKSVVATHEVKNPAARDQSICWRG
jgi:hypothetical protein